MIFLIGLIVIDLTISIVIFKKFTRMELQRLPADDEATLQLWVDQVKKCDGYKVVVLGDSVIHGLAAEKDAETVPAFIARDLREQFPGKRVRVFNLGLAGAAPAEIYFTMNALSEAGVKLFVYNINLGWFAREYTLEHTNLTKLKGIPQGLDWREMGIEQEENISTPVQAWLSEHVFSHWNLYRYRILLNCWLFEKPLREKMEEAKKDLRLLLPYAEDKLPETIEMKASWLEKDWTGKLDPGEGRVGDFTLNQENRQWIFYQMTLDLIESRRLPAVFFITPRNYELLDCYDMIDREAFTRNLSAITGAAWAADVPVLDYDSAIDNKYFSDIVHLLPEGNRLLADMIARDLIEKGYAK